MLPNYELTVVGIGEGGVLGLIRYGVLIHSDLLQVDWLERGGKIVKVIVVKSGLVDVDGILACFAVDALVLGLS